MDFTLHHKKNKITIEVKKLRGIERYLGLMFKKKDSENLLFEFEKDVKLIFHSLFVFFPFLLIWLDDKNRVIEYRRVNPFTICIIPRKSFKKVVEIPFSSSTAKFLAFLDGRGKV